jgi:hypothetical protein
MGVFPERRAKTVPSREPRKWAAESWHRTVPLRPRGVPGQVLAEA